MLLRRHSGRLAPFLLLLAVASGTPSCDSGSSPVHFVDGTEEAGILFRHDNGRSEDLFYVESIPVGAIFFDAEQDGDADLYLLNGARLAEPKGALSSDVFYANDGTGHFADATAGSGLGDPSFSEGVSGADYDNDGDQDLYVTNFDAPNALYQNDGRARFRDAASEALVVGGPAFDSSSAFADLDNDGWLDLYVGSYMDHSMSNNPVCAWPKRDGSGPARRYCSVERFQPLPDILYRNRGDGTFEDVSASSGISHSIGRTLGIAFADYDDDGDQDIFVSSDRGANRYYENQGGLRFQEIGMRTGAALSKTGEKQAGMGVASDDFDGDGKIDVAVTYFEEEWNGFYKNLGGHLFTDVAEKNGTSVPSYALLGWGIDFFDADLDSDLDCLIANGHFLDNVHLFREPLAGYEQPLLFFLNDGQGNFESLGTAAGPALETEKVGRGLATADVDNDGDVDALVANLHDRPQLLINRTPRDGKHWLLVRTIGTKSNRDGIGARLIAHLDGKTLVQEVHSGQSIFSQSDLRVHFGLGASQVVPLLEVRWPSGRVSRLENVAADQILEVIEPE